MNGEDVSVAYEQGRNAAESYWRPVVAKAEAERDEARATKDMHKERADDREAEATALREKHQALRAELELFHDEELAMGVAISHEDGARIQRRFSAILDRHFPEED